jgi:hypothetical protein
VGEPTPNDTLRLVTEGGQPPTPVWGPRYTQDDESTWQYAFHKNITAFNSLVIQNPQVPHFWPFALDDPPAWDRQVQVQRFLGAADIKFAPVARPSFWTSTFDEPDWYAKPVPSLLLRELTAQTPSKPKPWKQDIDDPGVWAHVNFRNIVLFGSITARFQVAWAANANVVVGGIAT